MLGNPNCRSSSVWESWGRQLQCSEASAIYLDATGTTKPMELNPYEDVVDGENVSRTYKLLQNLNDEKKSPFQC